VDDPGVLNRALERERSARKEAERLLEEKSAELYSAQQLIRKHNELLEVTVQQRTEELARALLLRDRYAREVAAARDAALAANRAKSEFLANMSHELRTPLHGALSFARFGIRECHTAPREQLLDYFKNIEESGQTLRRLLDDLLDLAKLESGKMMFEFDRADLSLLVLAVADEFNALAAEKRLSIDFHEPAFAPVALVDKQRIQQVLRNLLSNAVKFSPEAAAPIEIRISRDDGRFRVRIRDHGIGIPDGELETVFDKFVQSSKTKSAAGGTGLGLAICREIVAGHGGRIWAERPDGPGALIVCEIPQDSPADSPDAGLETAPTPVA
jgi:signal transduction histidine kinase